MATDVYLQVDNLSADKLAVGPLENLPGQMSISNSINFNIPNDVVPQTLNAQMTSYSQRIDFDNPSKDGLQSQDSFGKWINYMIAADSPGSVDDPSLEPATLPGYQSFPSPSLDNKSSAQEHIFNITDVSPAWAFSTEETKVLLLYSNHVLLTCYNIYHAKYSIFLKSFLDSFPNVLSISFNFTQI